MNNITDTGKHYIYRYIRLDKNEPFYIGVGTKHARDDRYNTFARAQCKKVSNRIWKGIANRCDYEYDILLESDDYAFIKQKEVEFIKLYGRINKGTGSLSNLTDGGEGVVGIVRAPITEETRTKLIESHKGKRLSAESQAKRIATLKEKYRINPPVCSEEQKERLRQYQLGSKQSQEHIQKRLATIKRNKEKFKNGETQVKIGNCKIIKNIETGEMFTTVPEAADSIGMKPDHLYPRMSGQVKNKTPFRYIQS